jgi:predicted dehydrogenase
MNEIRFGIIGTGRMAATMMAAFAHVPNVKVVAVASGSKERADRFAQLFSIATAYGSSDALLANSQVDAVYIANATESHAANTILALQAGKAVLCEKPIGISVAEAGQITAAAKHAGKLCMEAMWTPFLPAYQRLFKLVNEQGLGVAQHLYTDFGYPTNKDVYPRLFTPSPGAGVLLDRGVYPIVLALKLFGAVSQVSGYVVRTDEGVDTLASFQLKHTNGCVSQLAVSVTGLLQNRAVLSLAKGVVSLEPPVIGAENLKIVHAQIDVQAAPADGSALQPSLKQRLKQSPLLRRINSWRQSGGGEYHSYGANQYVPMLNHFCTLYRAGMLESEAMPLSLSADVLHIVEQAQKL